ncbi:MAG TPA: alkaline phosphatase family protein [Kofleriaceae bacterium]|nr:alkaline phosphatase family protein [Kofleriaceae bacterium]
MKLTVPPCLALAGALVPALFACAGAPRAATEAPRPGTEPRLVVLLVVDQWPEWAFEAKRPALTAGFDRLLREGEWHVGQHPSAVTLTAPGHAMFGSGEPPYRSGILANEWWHRDVERQLPSIKDEDGAITTRWLRVRGLGDAIAAANNGGKAVSVALKDRAAILPLGHTGTAIWYDARAVAWASYRSRAGAPVAPPAWLAAWNASHPIAPHLHDVWTPLPETAGLAGVPDDAPGEVGEKGLGPTFPHALDRTRDPAGAIFATPLGDELVLDTATAAIEREQLGADATADLLVVSLSAHDYIGHGWGHESQEAWDAALRLDLRLDQFLADLDTRVGAGRWAMIVTSDHGASPMPESLHGGRITYAQIKDAANRAAIAELGPGEWIASARFPTLYLSRAALAQKPRDLSIALTKIVYALRSFPGLARVEKSSDFWGRCETRTGDALALCVALDPERSGEVVFLPAAGWVLESADEPVATNHGSLQAYDRQVPVILLPPGRIRHAALTAPDSTTIPLVRVATILARWLGVTPPSALP